MNGIPKDLKTDNFLGKELSQICVSQYHVDFVFSDELRIKTEVPFLLYSSDAASRILQGVPIVEGSVFLLIGKQIAAVQILDKHHLRIEFEGDGALVFIDSSRSFESFSIRIDQDEVFV